MTARVAVVGLWHLGLVTCAGLAERGHDVIAVDPDAERVRALVAGRLPVHEPGLAEALAEAVAAGRLRFSDDLAELAGCDLAWLTVDTPLAADGSPDTTSIDALVDGLEAVPPIVLVSSQVPVGTCGAIQERLASRASVAVGYVPENLRLGRALQDFREPDFVVVGASEPRVASAVTELLGQPVYACELATAELAKHALNALLATVITFANGIGDVAESVGADAHAVAEILRKDSRLSPRLPLVPGSAFFGGTLARDLHALRLASARHDIGLDVVRAVLAANERRTADLVERLGRLVPLDGARVALLGFVYKPGTDAMRDAPGHAFERALRARGAAVAIHEPAVAPSEWTGGWVETPEEALAGADAVILVRRGVTEPARLAALVAQHAPRAVLDLWGELPAHVGPETVVLTPGRPRPEEVSA